MNPNVLRVRSGPGTCLLFIMGVACLAIGVAACRRTQQAERPECPVDTAAWVMKGDQRITLTQIPIAGPISNIPEFHDCQRFVKDTLYDSLYAIYASFRLASLDLRLDSLADTTIHPEFIGKQVAVPVATVFSYGGTYVPLRIEPGFNCLYLWLVGKAWHAKMVPMGPSEPRCGDPIVDPEGAPGKELLVLPPGGGPSLSVPAISRWDWDSVNAKQYVGIKCGNAWCEIGDSDLVSTPPYSGTLVFDPVPVGTASPTAVLAVARIKGWNDVQRLAVKDGDHVVPSMIWGTIVPHPLLDKLDDPAKFKSWVHVADEVVEGPAASYPKLNLTAGVNKVYLCHNIPSACGITSPPACAADPTDGIQWWARITSGIGASVDRCVVRRTHTDPGVPPIPGAARWRWQAKDETNWIRCPTGCCEIK